MEHRPGPVTIRDIAKAAGVSVATVSRTLNGSPSVDPELARRIKVEVERTGYVRNAMGRALRRQVSDVWAAIVPDLNTFYTGVVSSFESTAIEAGYSVMLCNSNEELARERRYAVAATAQQMAGAVLAVTSEHDTEPIRTLAASMPVVLFDREVSGYTGDCVVVDNEMTGRLVGQHLLAQGFERPACIVGPVGVSSTEGRLQGFLRAMADAGVGVPPERVVRVPLRPEEGARAMRELMALPVPPDAVFATTGPLTIGVYQTLQELGVRIGSSVALVGHDDDQWTQIVAPQISVIRQPVAQIGVAVAERLIARANGLEGPGLRQVLAPELVVRQSSLRGEGPLRGE